MRGIQRARWLRVWGCDTPLVSSAGAALLIETARVSGLAGALSTVLKGWRRPRAAHDPGKVLLDVAIALGLSDLAVGIVWYSIFTQLGYLNSILQGLGLIDTPSSANRPAPQHTRYTNSCRRP